MGGSSDANEAGGRNRVLVVDDEATTIAIVQRALAGAFDVFSAPTGADGVSLAKALQPGVVLLDVVLPGIGGLEVCRLMRADPALAHAKILMMSAFGCVDERLRGYQAGADDYLTKPFDPDELRAKVTVYSRLTTDGELRRLKGDLIDLLAHEMRTPLSGILPAAELLEQPGEVAEAERRELAQMIRISGRRLANLGEAMLTLSQARCGSLEMAVGEVDLVELAAAALADVAATYGDVRGARLVAPRSAPVRADRRHLAKVVEMLLEQALRSPGYRPLLEVIRGEDHSRLVLHMPDRRSEVRESRTVLDPIRRGGEVVGADIGMLVAHVVASALAGRVRSVATDAAYAIELSLPAAPARR